MPHEGGVRIGLSDRTARRLQSIVPALLTLVCLSACATPIPMREPGAACSQPGYWFAPSGEGASAVATDTVLDRLSGQHVVLLGETHDRADDHRWQLDVLTALHERNADIAVGFEMFPRRVQAVLDRWVAGELSEDEFLKQVEWEKVWGYDAQFYLPLFRFARQHRLPMLALNVDRSLVQQISAKGWDAVPDDQRQGVGRPAPPEARYSEVLKTIFDSHVSAQNDTGRFDYFVQAQTLWDRAMAEAIVTHLRAHPQRRVVGILGAGHIQDGYGVPYQLRSLGVTSQASLLTWPSDRPCAALSPNLADALYVIPPQPKSVIPPPRLGVRLAMAADGVLIEAVQAGSLAEQTGIRAGDVVVQAAGRKPAGIDEFRGMIQRQPAGTWLPLQIRRESVVLDMVVRFPVQP